MKATDVLIQVQENLNQIALPDGNELSDKDAHAIEAHLRHIFLEAFCSLDSDEIEQFTQNILTEFNAEAARGESSVNLNQKFVHQFKQPLFKPIQYVPAI